MATDPGNWAITNALFDRLVALPRAARDAALRRAAAPAEIKAHVARMLAAIDAAPGFLADPPALQAAGDGRSGDVIPNYSSLAAGSLVGGFVVDRLIGRGGTGEVYLAHRQSADFSRAVALKLLRPEAAGQMLHFEGERRILAALEHPGIARLIDGGIAADGRPYMVMEHVDGLDVLSYCRSQRLDLAARLRLFRQVCDAVDAAHRNSVVHRDLKPANILVGRDGTPKLLDFGIAKLLGGTGGDATQGMLTPDHAAPEQWQGGAVTTATDVFALGVLLFQMLTDRLPWQGTSDSVPASVQRLLDIHPPLPSEVVEPSSPVSRRALRGDLDAIVRKALRQVPAERYQSPADLSADIERWRTMGTVTARADERSYRVRRFVRRHRALLAAVTLVILALATGLLVVTRQARAIAAERDQVLVEMARAEAVKNAILLMFRTAGESDGADALTAKQVLDRSAVRISEQYRDRPRMRAEVVETLGALYLYMNDYDGAIPLLRGYLDATPSKGGSAQRAEISILLAEAELRRGNPVQARTLLDAAQAVWGRDTQRYRKSLVASRQLQAQVEKEEQGLPASIRTLQAALVEHDGYFGRRHVETANLLNSLGIAYQANGDIDLADAAFADSWDVHRALHNERSAAALLTLGNWATVAYRKNDLARAERLLLQATATRRALYGDSAALAAMQANLGKIILRMGRPADALAQLQQALPLALRYTGNYSPLTVAILQSITEAQLGLGQLVAADATLQQAKAAARTNSGEGQILYALCLGLEARLQQARGDRDGARALAARMAAKIHALGDAGIAYQPEVTRLESVLALGAPH